MKTLKNKISFLPVIYQVKTKYIAGISLALGGSTFLTNPTHWCWVLKRKNSSKKNCGHLVQPVQLFESAKFRDIWSTLTCYISYFLYFTNSNIRPNDRLKVLREYDAAPVT
jgi:hypothetical protein